ncbi:uncharacterized protein BcabD6B2_48050 [Babesia caballi]|uniref:Nucleocapsid protein n=1 Tax=Babesia caballi TaxID=5871 RepID=A0AAV4M0C7_BABCB|nr:hypothetical protein, conserved [Babesia caballi]
MSLRYMLNEFTEMKQFHDKMKNNASTYVFRLAHGLQNVIGYQWEKGSANGQGSWKINAHGIVNPGEIYKKISGASQTRPQSSGHYKSAYKGSWNSDIDTADYDGSKRRKAVQNFFTAIEKIFEGLTELFFKCKNGWSKQSLSGSGDEGLKQFMNDNGYETTKLNTSMTGNKITDTALKNFTEFSKAYETVSANPSLDAFRAQLEQNAWLDSSASPLSVLYILATYAYVRSTSPATPSFAGYSGTAALAGGAYGFNLGGLGAFSLNSEGCVNSGELTTLKEVLGKAKALVEKDVEPKYAFKFGPIGQLSIALRDFIGYTSYGVLSDSSQAGKITGSGIAPSNMATHRLCDATIAFTIGVLEGCKKVRGGHVTRLDGVITKLQAAYGKGAEGLEGVATQAQSGLTGSWGQVNQFVVDLKNACHTNFSSGLRDDDAVTVASKVGEYIRGGFTVLKGSIGGGGASQITRKLTILVQGVGEYAHNTSDGSFGN